MKCAAKSFTFAVAIFSSLVITHAAFVDYRCWILIGQRNLSFAMQTTIMSSLQQDSYIQDRKYAGMEIATSVPCDRGQWRKNGTKSRRTELGLCSGVFELLVVMKGGLTRSLILEALADGRPKNKLQLAALLAIDWKAVDRHVDRLLEYNLVDQ